VPFGSIPGSTTEEIHWVSIWSTFFDNDTFSYTNYGWDNSGWQFNQAAMSHFHWGEILVVSSAGRYWTWSYPLQIYTTNSRLDRNYTC